MIVVIVVIVAIVVIEVIVVIVVIVTLKSKVWLTHSVSDKVTYWAVLES